MIWFSWFYGISTIVGYIMPNSVYTYIIYMIWFGGVLWHINHCRLFNAKSSLYIYNIYMIWFSWVLWHINHCRLFNAKSSSYIYDINIWFGLVGSNGRSTIVGYIMPNSVYTYIIYMIWFSWVLWQINQCNNNLMPNPVYTYTGCGWYLRRHIF